MVCKMKVMLRCQTFQCQCHLHACATENLSCKCYCTPYLLSLNSWWFDSNPWERKTNDYKNMLRCTILTQLDPEWKWAGKDHTAELIYPNRNGMIQCLAVSLHIGTCLFEEGERWQWKFVVSASSRWCLWHLVWQEAFTVLLADQHRKWSCLVGASTCFWS